MNKCLGENKDVWVMNELIFTAYPSSVRFLRNDSNWQALSTF